MEIYPTFENASDMRNIVRYVIILLGLITLFSCSYHRTGDKQPQKATVVSKDSVIAIPQTTTITKSDSMQSPSLYDPNKDVAGGTQNIEAIMKSIANGDAEKLTSLCSFPIERKYPMRDIKDSKDMLKKFNKIFDREFREKIKHAKISDWKSNGYRGYSWGEENASIWVYDSLTIIDYYSPQEQQLYDELVKQEMESLHESIRGNGWHPFCCYKDITDGSIIRIDIRERKVKKEENFHTDGFIYCAPQLQPFKLRGDEEFRLAAFPKKYDLKGRPKMLLNGYVDIGGSANMRGYYFQKGNLEIYLGDIYYKSEKGLLSITKDGIESKHDVEPCYWLDLVQ